MSANVFKKILAVRKDVGPIKKSGKNKFQGYDYQTADEVFTVVRSAMNAHDLLLFPSMTEVHSDEGSWVVNYNMTWADADSGETWTESWAMTLPMEARSKSSGDYIDDKAMGKAGTYALRYYLLRTLQITTKDDVENDIDAGNPDTIPSRKRKEPLPRARKRDGDTFRSSGQSVGQEEAAPDSVDPEPVDWKKFHGWLAGIGLTHEDARVAVTGDKDGSLSEWLEEGGTKDEMMKRIEAHAALREAS
jgi:hypothetical protein